VAARVEKLCCTGSTVVEVAETCGTASDFACGGRVEGERRESERRERQRVVVFVHRCAPRMGACWAKIRAAKLTGSRFPFVSRARLHSAAERKKFDQHTNSGGRRSLLDQRRLSRIVSATFSEITPLPQGALSWVT